MHERYWNWGIGEETLAYADHVAIITNNIIDLHDVGQRWHHVLSELGMKINTGAGKQSLCP